MDIQAVHDTGHPLAEDKHLHGLMEEAHAFKAIFQRHAEVKSSPPVDVVNDAFRTLFRLDHVMFQYVTSLSDERSVDQHLGTAKDYIAKVEEAAEPLRRYVTSVSVKA